MSRVIALTQGKVAIVDENLFEYLNQWKWTYLQPSYSRGSGYAYRQTVKDGKHTQIYMHRLIMDAPKGTEVDHVNHDGLCNLRENLRIATPSQNHYNSRPRKGTSSQYKGVYYDKKCQRWGADIICDKQKTFLGYFDSEFAAAIAYNEAALKLHGGFALLNNLENHQESDLPVTPKKVPTSKCTGVSYYKRRNVWVAEIQIDKKAHYLGAFATEQEAIDARKKGEINLKS